MGTYFSNSIDGDYYDSGAGIIYQATGEGIIVVDHFNRCFVNFENPSPTLFTIERMRLLIKNMVSLRCKIIVKSVLEDIGFHYTIVELGEVEIEEDLSPEKFKQLNNALTEFGFELMEDRKNILIEKIKNIVVELIHYSDEPLQINFSTFLSEQLGYEYHYLSNLFSEVKGTTIEQYIISHKIERAKELLIYNELSLTEIAFKLHYSSVAHLSNQFKKVTGLTPSFFRNMKHQRLTGRGRL